MEVTELDVQKTRYDVLLKECQRVRLEHAGALSRIKELEREQDALRKLVGLSPLLQQQVRSGSMS